MVKDMTEGKPGRLILEFAIPLLLGNLFQQFYSLVDTAIVGKFLGVDQLAAVGSTGSINFLIIGFCMGICSGFAIPIAQRFGAKDESGMRRCVANSAWVSVIFAVVLTIVTVLLCRNILQWMRTPENIIDDAWMYIVIIFAGIPVTILYNLTSAIIRAMGDSKTPVYFLVMSALLNIVLDLFCILVLKMGVAGAALATVISQAISGICCLVYMIRKYEILRMQGTEGKSGRNGCSDGIAVFRYGDRQRYFAERGQYARFHCGCSGYGIRENQRIFRLPVRCAGCDDGDLGRAEYGREEAEANP